MELQKTPIAWSCFKYFWGLILPLPGKYQWITWKSCVSWGRGLRKGWGGDLWQCHPLGWFWEPLPVLWNDQGWNYHRTFGFGKSNQSKMVRKNRSWKRVRMVLRKNWVIFRSGVLEAQWSRTAWHARFGVQQELWASAATCWRAFWLEVVGTLVACQMQFVLSGLQVWKRQTQPLNASGEEFPLKTRKC